MFGDVAPRGVPFNLANANRIDSGLFNFNQYRCYLVSGNPTADGSSSGNSTVYVGPYQGNIVTYYNGQSFINLPITEVACSLSGLTSTSVYDLYVDFYYRTYAVSTWSGSTPPTRSTDPLGRATYITNTSQLYVGSFYALTSTTTADWTGARCLTNVYNAVQKVLKAQDSTSSWTNSSTTPVASNGNTAAGTGQVLVLSLGVSPVALTNYGLGRNSTAGSAADIGIGEDSTTSATAAGYITSSVATAAYTLVCADAFMPSIGKHYYQRLDWITGSGTGTFFGGASGQMVGTCWS